MATRLAAVGRSFVENGKKVIFISGCDSGLGFSLAHRCNSEGLVVLAGCLQHEGEGARQLIHKGVNVFPLDVTKPESVASATAHVSKILRERNLELQAVVNNAGIMVFGEFEWQTPRLIENQILVNIRGSFNVAQEFLPLLRNYQGRLINIVSHCAIAGLPGLSVYGATKAALLNWNDCLRIEQAKYGVKIISVIPGSFFGESNIMAKQASYADEMRQGMSKITRSQHENYFNEVQQYLSKISPPKGPVIVSDEALHQKLLHAILATTPKHFYSHAPLRYTIYHTLFKICPIWIRDRLVERFVSLPTYMKK